MNTGPDDLEAKRRTVVSRMIASLKRGEDREYFVGLVGYFIEGIPYSASSFSVDRVATPEINRTDKGFSCAASFPPSLLQPSTVKQKGIKKVGTNEIVQVQLEVRLIDIWTVAEFIAGTQHDLFSDPETFISRKMAFMSEMNDFFRKD